MKPFFTNPFKPLITRTGTAIGKAAERTMLQAVDGPFGIRKRFQVNPDGSKTMLHTQNGLARFSGLGTVVAAANTFTIENGDFVAAGVTSTHAEHYFHETTQSWTGKFRMWLVNKLGVPNLRIYSLSYGFTIVGNVVTTPPGWLWHPSIVNVTSDNWPDASSHIGEVAYEIHIGPTLKNKPDVFAVGIVAGA